MSYILSNSNRFYTALESSYGVIPAITAVNSARRTPVGHTSPWNIGSGSVAVRQSEYQRSLR